MAISVNEGRQRDGCEVLGPEFNSWDSHGGKRELQGHAGLHPKQINKSTALTTLGAEKLKPKKK